MASELQPPPGPEQGPIELPRPTAAPLVLSLGLALLAAGAMFGWGFALIGAVVLLTGLGLWVADLLPGRGHAPEPLVEPARRAQPITGQPGTVRHLETGTPGYRTESRLAFCRGARTNQESPLLRFVVQPFRQ